MMHERVPYFFEPMGKIVGITYDLKSDWPSGPNDPVDASAEFDSPQTVENICRALESRGHRVKKIGNARNLLKEIDHLDVDIVFNICEGFAGRSRESQVPVLLEMFGIPYVGSDGLTMGIALDKIAAKKCFLSEGIPTPRFFTAKNSNRLGPFDSPLSAEQSVFGLAQGEPLKKNSTRAQINSIGFPLIVKPSREGSSKGLSEKSRVTDFEGLKRQIEGVHHTYHQSALVEEFIRGTEFTVAVIGNDHPQAMPVVQVSIDGVRELGDDFYTFSRLLNPDRVQYLCPADIPKNLEQKLKALAVRVYNCVECLDFGRVDFRVDEKGNPTVLEINPLPCLAINDIFFFTAKAMGFTYEDIINHILELALVRYGMNDHKEAKT